MDVYRKILVKLYEETGGKQSNTVNFIDLVKAEGFYPSYDDILKQLTESAWITETSKQDLVQITHWGVKEAKKALVGGGGNSRELERNANRLKSEVKEFLVMTEEFVGELSEEKFKQVDKKLTVVKKAIEKLKPNF